MRKIIVLTAIFLLAVSLCVAAGGEKTENGEDVNIVKEKKKLAGGGDDDRKGWKEVTLPGAARDGGKTVGAGQVTEIIELTGNGDGNGDEVSEAAHELTHVVQQGEARKGRNPQTGKEIKIPVADAEDPDGTVEPYVWVIENADDTAQEELTVAFEKYKRTH